MAQQPPPPFPSRFAGPPALRGFPPRGPPHPGPFRGGPAGPPPPFSPFPPFSPGGGRGDHGSGGACGLPPSAYPPPLPRPPFPAPPWPPQQQQHPDRPSPPQWRPEAPPLPAPLRPEGPAPAGGGDNDDERWLGRFLSRRHRGGDSSSAPPPLPPPRLNASQVGQVASQALRLVAQVAAACGAWRRGEESEAAEEEAEARLAELRELVRPLRSGGGGQALAAAAKKRAQQRRRRRQRRQEARQEEAARRAEREARIDRWRARRAQEVEERRREQELKAAADSVLSEVRKKQADTKRMAEILRGLEKLRKLRKEAAGRKGVCPPPAADEAFENEIQDVRASIKKRTELYEAEERALRVMLEGEQEEERKREMEKKQKKEREKLLQQKREIDSKLFGDPEEYPLNHLLEPFRQFYLQAEYSAPALIQIRHEWDRYLVPADHPEGSFIPPGWVLPSLPSNDIWATAVG